MIKKGFITAGGKGSRWGNYYKELLPIGEHRWLLDKAVERLARAGVDEVVIITRPEKVCIHATHLADKVKIPVSYVMQEEEELWGAIKTACRYAGHINLLTMSDTLPSDDCFDFSFIDYDFGLGTFQTLEPERFGIVTERDKRKFVVDKLKTDVPATAWGTFWFSKKVADTWLKVSGLKNYTEAINLALSNFSSETIKFIRYYDMVNFTKYSEFINEKI